MDVTGDTGPTDPRLLDRLQQQLNTASGSGTGGQPTRQRDSRASIRAGARSEQAERQRAAEAARIRSPRAAGATRASEAGRDGATDRTGDSRELTSATQLAIVEQQIQALTQNSRRGGGQFQRRQQQEESERAPAGSAAAPGGVPSSTREAPLGLISETVSEARRNLPPGSVLDIRV